MKGWIIVFRLPTGTAQNVRVRFGQRFWGQTTTSHGGRYRFHRSGLMEEVPHRKLARGVILVRSDGLGRVRSFLADHGAETHIREVTLEDEDLDHLSARN